MAMSTMEESHATLSSRIQLPTGKWKSHLFRNAHLFTVSRRPDLPQTCPATVNAMQLLARVEPWG